MCSLFAVFDGTVDVLLLNASFVENSSANTIKINKYEIIATNIAFIEKPQFILHFKNIQNVLK